MSTNQPIIPAQYTGTEINAERTVTCSTADEAKLVFETARQRLQNVNQWHEVAGQLSAKFQLFNDQVEEVDREVQKGDYFQVDIPGPGSTTGKGYDWVQVEDLAEEHDNNSSLLAFRVRPTSNPTTNADKAAHFFSSESTSTFLVKRENEKVTVGIYDRNAKPNTETENLIDKTRNLAVATSGILGVTKLHWQHLADRILD